MFQLNNVHTIPDLFYGLTEEYRGRTDKPIMKYKTPEGFTGITYDEFREITEQFACGLAALGVKSEDRIALISENRPEWVYTDMAVLALGAYDVPLYPSLTSETIEFTLNNSESVGIVASNRMQLNKILKIRKNCKFLKFIIVFNEEAKNTTDAADVYSFNEIAAKGKPFRAAHPNYLQEQRRHIKGTDLCTIIYTSGTTGEPKGVMLTHLNILSNVKASKQIISIKSDDVLLSFLPMCHIFERMGGYYTAFSSEAVVCFAQSIETIAQDMQDTHPTIMTAVPRLFERMYSRIMKNIDSQAAKKQKIFHWAIQTGVAYNHAKKLGSIPMTLSIKRALADKLVFKKLREKMGGKLRFFISGSAALARDLAEFFEAFGILIIEGYGLTESSPVLSANHVDNYKFGSVGKPLPGITIKIASDGEILAKGPSIMQGYYKNKKETDAVLKDGWLHTGDIGVFDGDGFLLITDRKKHLFKTSGGKYVAPTPIENMFLASKYIDQFILIGDRRMYLSALIVPDFEAIKEYADSSNIHYSNEQDLINNNEIVDLVEKELLKFQKNLANYERVRKFALLEKPFSLETGELTPSLKLRRKIIEERYKDLIDGMYNTMG